MSSRKNFNILVSSVDGIINERVFLNNHVDNFKRLNTKNSIEDEEFLVRINNVSNYVGKQIQTIKNYLINTEIVNVDVEEIGRVVYLLGLMLDCCSKSIDLELYKRGYGEPVEWGLLSLSMDYVPMYQEVVYTYMKKLGFNN